MTRRRKSRPSSDDLPLPLPSRPHAALNPPRPEPEAVSSTEAVNPDQAMIFPAQGLVLGPQYALRWLAEGDRVQILTRPVGSDLSAQEVAAELSWSALAFLLEGLLAPSSERGHPTALAWFQAVKAYKLARNPPRPSDMRHLLVNVLEGGLPVNSTIQECAPPSLAEVLPLQEEPPNTNPSPPSRLRNPHDR